MSHQRDILASHCSISCERMFNPTRLFLPVISNSLPRAQYPWDMVNCYCGTCTLWCQGPEPGPFSSRFSPCLPGPSTPSPLPGEGRDGGGKHGLGTPPPFTPTLSTGTPHHPCPERDQVLLAWLFRTKSNMAAWPSLVSCTVISKCGLKSPSVAFDGSSGK